MDQVHGEEAEGDLGMMEFFLGSNRFMSQELQKPFALSRLSMTEMDKLFGPLSMGVMEEPTRIGYF